MFGGGALEANLPDRQRSLAGMTDFGFSGGSFSCP